MTQETLLTVSLYLRGDKLDPAYITEQLGISPTTSQYKGEKTITRTNHEVIKKIGLWALYAKSKSFALAEHIEELLSTIGKKPTSFLSIDGVDEAYIDVFVMWTANKKGDSGYEFEIDAALLSRMSSLGLTLKVTAGTSGED